jgi:hypothetical protein
VKRILGTTLINDLVAVLFLVSASAVAQHGQVVAAPLSHVHAALQVGEAGKARTFLNSLPVPAEAHNLRCRVLAQQGDKTAEGEQEAAALALAYDYKPAWELKF